VYSNYQKHWTGGWAESDDYDCLVRREVARSVKVMVPCSTEAKASCLSSIRIGPERVATPLTSVTRGQCDVSPTVTFPVADRRHSPTAYQIVPTDYRGIRISTDKRVARSLCNSTASCFISASGFTCQISSHIPEKETEGYNGKDGIHDVIRVENLENI